MANQTDPDAVFELELTQMAHGGSALGRYQGRTIFVPYAIPGERITARIVQDKGRFAHAQRSCTCLPLRTRASLRPCAPRHP